jgi:hypothetical protein
LGSQIAAFSLEVGSSSFALKDLKISTFFCSATPLAIIKLRSTVLNAFKISAETLSANSAVSTRYIMLIIFCRGSLGSDILYYLGNLINNEFLNLCWLLSTLHRS